MDRKSTGIDRKFGVRSLGCKANWVDGENLRSVLKNEGFQEVKSSEDEADLWIVNSCSVTDEADRQSFKLARDLKKKYPKSQIVFTGCSAEISPAQSKLKAHADFVVGNHEKARFRDFLRHSFQGAEVWGGPQEYKEFSSRHPMDRDWPMPDLHEVSNQGRTRAFLKIQEGCDTFCTYCIIPYGRGPSRSLEPEKVRQMFREAELQGVKEVVLTATNLGDYPDLSGLVFQLLKGSQPTTRLRLSSLSPVEITEGIYQLMSQNSQLCPHIHLSLQSPIDKILKAMKRPYVAKDVTIALEKLSMLKTPSGLRPYVGMDIITGFPGETDDDFQESLNVLRNSVWDRLHVFPYSERSGTPATKMKNPVPKHVRNERAKELRALSLERLKTNTEARLGLGLRSVLCESKGQDGRWRGYTPDYRRCVFAASESVRDLQRKFLDLVPASSNALVVDQASGEVEITCDVTSYGEILNGLRET